MRERTDLSVFRRLAEDEMQSRSLSEYEIEECNLSSSIAEADQALRENDVTMPEALSKKLEDLERIARENLDKYLHICAEFENHKKRTAREQEAFTKFSNEKLIADILP